MIKIIASGSKGNCYKYFDVMVDVGVSYKAIKGELEGVNYILLTHSHGDHLKLSTIKRIVKDNPQIFVVTPSYLIERVSEVVPPKNIVTINWGDTLFLGDNEVTAGKLYHDVPNSGYLINNLGYKVFHATDTKHLEGVSVKGCDYYGVECNYSQNKFDNLNIRSNLTDEEKKQLWLFRNSVETHLSDEQFDKFIKENNTNGGIVKKYHISERNS